MQYITRILGAPVYNDDKDQEGTWYVYMHVLQVCQGASLAL